MSFFFKCHLMSFKYLKLLMSGNFKKTRLFYSPPLKKEKESILKFNDQLVNIEYIFFWGGKGVISFWKKTETNSEVMT